MCNYYYRFQEYLWEEKNEFDRYCKEELEKIGMENEDVFLTAKGNPTRNIKHLKKKP